MQNQTYTLFLTHDNNESLPVDSTFDCVGGADLSIEDMRRHSLVSSQTSTFPDCSSNSTGFSSGLSIGPHTPISGTFDWNHGPSPSSSMSDSQTSTLFSSAEILTPETTPHPSPDASFIWSNHVASQYDAFKPQTLEYDRNIRSTEQNLSPTFANIGYAAEIEGCQPAPRPSIVADYDDELRSHQEQLGTTQKSSTFDHVMNGTIRGIRSRRRSGDCTHTRITKTGGERLGARQRRKSRTGSSRKHTLESDTPCGRMTITHAPKAVADCKFCPKKFGGEAHKKRHMGTASSCKSQSCKSRENPDSDGEPGDFDCPIARRLGTLFCDKLTVGDGKPVSRHDNIAQHMSTHVAHGSGTPRNKIVEIQIVEACIAMEADNEEKADRQKGSVHREMKGNAEKLRAQGKSCIDLSGKKNAHISHEVMQRLGFDCSIGHPDVDSEGHPMINFEDLEGNIVGRGRACKFWAPPKCLPEGQKRLEIDGSCFAGGRPLQLPQSKASNSVCSPDC